MLCAASSQWNTSEIGQTSLKYEVLVMMAGTFNIEVNEAFYEKVRGYESAVLKCYKDKMPKPGKKGKGK